MAWASRLGRARISAKSPQAAGVCDRCGFIWTHSSLQKQADWRGAVMMNTNIMVCRRCLDTPQAQWRAIILPPDPVPIQNPRINTWDDYSTDYRATQAGRKRGTEDFQYRVTQPTGPAGVPQYPAAGRISSNGLEMWAIMPNAPDGAVYDRRLQVLSVIADGTTVIAVTCLVPHGLADNDQVSMEGLSDIEACGFYSVAVTTATAFTYRTNAPRPMGSLL